MESNQQLAAVVAALSRLVQAIDCTTPPAPNAIVAAALVEARRALEGRVPCSQ